jgi:hypothetical protein
MTFGDGLRSKSRSHFDWPPELGRFIPDAAGTFTFLDPPSAANRRRRRDVRYRSGKLVSSRPPGANLSSV